MPLFFYKCNECENSFKFLLTPEQSKEEHYCPKDGNILARAPKNPTTSVKEVIDTGLVAKRIEQPVDSPELLQEREANQRKSKYKNEL